MRCIALIVAGGRGSRMADASGPKQYLRLGNCTLLEHAIRPFLVHDAIDTVVVVIHPEDRTLFDQVTASLSATGWPMAKLALPVFGGATRQQSVRNGLLALNAADVVRPDAVLIHDAARPFVSESDITGVIDALDGNDGAIVALPVVDTLKRAKVVPEPTGSDLSKVGSTVARDGLWRALTPQAFHFEAICAAHEAALTEGEQVYTDDAAIAEAAGLRVAIVASEHENFKITTVDDLARAKAQLRTMAETHYETRTGTGFDVHRLVPGDHVWLCGVKVPHGAALSGHSDADVAMHALTDALYGAIAEGDIGAHFPPSDPQWKGASSDTFLIHARDRVGERAGSIVNVDVTIICEAPKIGPHRDAMRARLAEILEVDTSRVAVKATTTETLGFAGREEGIAAMASATVRLVATVTS